MLEPHAARIAELARYYVVGVVNTAFGYGLFSLLVFLGLNLFVAQFTSSVIAPVFNYFMFRSHVFRESTASIWRYAGSYGVNYLLSVVLLVIIHLFIRSAYVSGFLALVVVSFINYFMLKLLVFRPKTGR